jgi:predicted transposase YbfD/YdcC
MEKNDLRDLESIFAQVEDPRLERTKLHRLRDIIILAICGVICGAEGWVEIEEFGKAKEAFFREWLDLPNGIPSHDTFGRVFALINPNQFEASFVAWVQGISKTIQGVVAIDGKTLRRSHDRAAGKKALHLVSAWAVENRLVLAQLATEEKSNEITAIPLLLQQLALKGCIVTIDAMGTQLKIADQIIEQEGEYALALKENQGNLYEEVKATFALAEKEACERCNGSSITRWRRVMDGWKSGTIGRSAALRSWTISIRKRDGKGCEGLGWFEPNGAWAKKPAWKRAIFCSVSRQWTRLLTPSEAIGGLKTASIGCWMWLFGKTNHECALDTLMKILPCYAISA